jgi:hypothetical protein
MTAPGAAPKDGSDPSSSPASHVVGWRMLLIVIAGLLMSAIGYVGVIFNLTKSFSFVGRTSDNVEEKAAALSQAIRMAMAAQFLSIVGLVVALVGPLLYWWLARRRSPS